MLTSTTHSPRAQTLSIPAMYRGVPVLLVGKGSSPRGLKVSIYKNEAFNTASTSPTSASKSTESCCSFAEFSISNEDSDSPANTLQSLQKINNNFSPGTLKSNSANLTSLVQTTKETLSKYGISLHLEVPGKHFKDVSKILKVLSYEIELFPAGFFQKINLKKLNIFYENDPKRAFNTFCLKSDILENDVKIAEKLYKIIYEHLIFAKPKIARTWREQVPIENSSGVQDNKELWCLEEVFIALMKNRSQPLLKQLMNTLKGLLKENFPGELTEEWFETRNSEKKKTRRVSFSS